MRSRVLTVARDSHNRADPDVQEMKSRALDTLEDEIRDTMREVIKEEITPIIREKAQGAVIVMLDMLPKAMARLAQDLDSKDSVARRNAVAITMKYAMPTVQDNTKVEEDRTHSVYHWIPAPPDTEVGQRVLDHEKIYSVEDNFEAFEEDWPICFRCNTRVHPEDVSHPHGKDREAYCNSCNIRARLENGDHTTDEFLNSHLIR